MPGVGEELINLARRLLRRLVGIHRIESLCGASVLVWRRGRCCEVGGIEEHGEFVLEILVVALRVLGQPR